MSLIRWFLLVVVVCLFACLFVCVCLFVCSFVLKASGIWKLFYSDRLQRTLFPFRVRKGCQRRTVCHQRHTRLARDEGIFLLHKIRPPENENETQCEETVYEVHVTHSGKSKESESATITLTMSENKLYNMIWWCEPLHESLNETFLYSTLITMCGFELYSNYYSEDEMLSNYDGP